MISFSPQCVKQTPCGFFYGVGHQHSQQQGKHKRDQGVLVLPGLFRGHVRRIADRGREAKPFQVNNHRLVDQVIVHADPAEEPGHPVAQELPQGEERKWGGKNQQRKEDRIYRPVDHLIHLNHRGISGTRLETQHLQQAEKCRCENQGGQGLPAILPQIQPFPQRFVRFLRDSRRCPFLLQPYIRHGRQDTDHVYVQEVDQLVYHHAVIHQRPQAPGPEAETHRAQDAKGHHRFFHHAAGNQREQEVSLRLNGQCPAGRAQRRRDIGVPEKGERERQMGRHILHHKLGGAVQLPGNRDSEQHRENNEIVSR